MSPESKLLTGPFERSVALSTNSDPSHISQLLSCSVDRSSLQDSGTKSTTGRCSSESGLPRQRRLWPRRRTGVSSVVLSFLEIAGDTSQCSLEQDALSHSSWRESVKLSSQVSRVMMDVDTWSVLPNPCEVFLTRSAFQRTAMI